MKIIDATDQKQWDDFITSHEEANFLQSWAWGDFHESRNKKVVRRIALKGEKIVAAYVGQVETARRGTYMAIAGGPIMDWSDDKLRQAIFDDIKKQGKANKCVFVRIRPQITETPKNRELFKQLGAKPAPLFPHLRKLRPQRLAAARRVALPARAARLRPAARAALAPHLQGDDYNGVCALIKSFADSPTNNRFLVNK